MKRLLVITQKVDESDDLLGFFVGWLREFAKYYEIVSVITLGVGTYELPANVYVYSLGKERGVPKWHQMLRLAERLRRLVPRHDAVFAHMSPIFAIAAWPFTAVWHKKLVLWYLHRSRTLRLRLALTLCDHLITADTASLTVQSPKIIAVGHGIDTERFTVPDRQPPTDRPLRILSVGRLASIKDFSALIRTAALLREQEVPVQVRIVGRALTAEHRKEEEQLHALVEELDVGDVVSFSGFISHNDMPKQYAWADVIVGCTPHGGLDKAILEGMAAGCVPFTSNDAMRPYFEGWADQLLFTHGNSEELAGKLAGLDDWEAMSHDVVAIVRREHEVTRTIQRISEFV